MKQLLTPNQTNSILKNSTFLLHLIPRVLNKETLCLTCRFVEFYKLVHVRSALDYSGNLLRHYPVLVRYVEVDDYLDKGPMPEVLDNPAVLVGPHEVSPDSERYRNMSRVVEDSRHPKLEPTQCLVLEKMFDKTLVCDFLYTNTCLSHSKC